MKTLFLISFLIFLTSCGMSFKDNKPDVKVAPFAGDSVYKSLLIEKDDNQLMPAFSIKSITTPKLKVVPGVTKEEVKFKITALPKKGKLFLDGVEVELKQDVTQSDIDRGALTYQHLSVPGEDSFELIAWSRDAQSKRTKFDLKIDIPLPRACSFADGTGIQSWDLAGEAYGSCVLNNCDDGFFLDNAQCVPQVCVPNEVSACALPLNSYGIGSQTCNALGSDFSTCALDSCDAGYHRVGNICELDVAPCGVSGGEGYKTWNGTSYGECIVSSCATSFYQSGNSCLPQICSPNSVSACSITNGAGTTQCSSNGSSLGPCLVQSCAAGYEFSGNACSAIPVTCSYPVMSGPYYEGVAINIPSPSFSGYQVQFRSLSSVAGVSLNSSNGQISIPSPLVQSYNLSVEAYSATSAVSCGTLNFTVNKSLIANDDTATTQQGQALVIDKATLMSNDSSLVGRTFNITSVVAVAGGSVSMSSSDVTFTPSALTGDYAAFDYTIVDSFGTSDTARVVVSLSALPPINALIFGPDDAAEMNQMLNTAPPSMQDLFDQWARFEANNYYANKAAAQGEALSWEFQTNPDRVQSNLNSTKYIGFISPEKLDKYTLQVDVSSSDSDDDAISLVIAFVRSGTKNYTLSAIRTQGGTMTKVVQGWALVYNYMQSDEVILGQLDVGGVFQNNAKTGWSNRSSRLKVVRNGNSVKIWASPWTTTDLTDASLISVDLNSQAYLSIFKGKQSYGYGAYSQKFSTYKNISLQGGSNLDMSTVYDADKDQVWTYSAGSGWMLSTQHLADSLGFPRTIYNPEIDKTFVLDRNGEVAPQ